MDGAQFQLGVEFAINVDIEANGIALQVSHCGSFFGCAGSSCSQTNFGFNVGLCHKNADVILRLNSLPSPFVMVVKRAQIYSTSMRLFELNFNYSNTQLKFNSTNFVERGASEQSFNFVAQCPNFSGGGAVSFLVEDGATPRSRRGECDALGDAAG